MSKGPGKWQRLILAELETRDAFYLRCLLDSRCTKAQYDALLRAALQLESKGQISIMRFLFGRFNNVIHKKGTTFTGGDRRKLDKDKCMLNPKMDIDIHLNEGVQ